MSVVLLYNGVFKVLANDSELLRIMGLTGANALQKALHLQKRAKPQNLANNLPIIAFYAPPGGAVQAKNDQVYTTPFVFDVYTNDDVDLAQRIAQRLYELFHNQINPFQGIESYENKFVTSYESQSDLANSYCFTSVFSMSISLGC